MAEATRVGLYGGTFDPVHTGHLRAAEEVAEACGLDRVEFVLAATPPHKPAGAVGPVEHRRRMLELALDGNPRFAVNWCELDRPGRSYSVDTIRATQAADPDAHLTFILGSDAFAEIETWKDYATLFGLADVCVMARPGSPVARPPIAVENAFCYDPLRGVYAHRSGRDLRFLPITALMISASDIRRRRALGASIRYLVPDAVRTYVETHQLYRGGTPPVDCA